MCCGRLPSLLHRPQPSTQCSECPTVTTIAMLVALRLAFPPDEPLTIKIYFLLLYSNTNPAPSSCISSMLMYVDYDIDMAWK